MKPSREEQRKAVELIRYRIEMISDDKLNWKLHSQFNDFVSALNMAHALPFKEKVK